MESSLANSILNVCKSLNRYSVEYMIVGGTAVALHGYFRLSKKESGEISEKPDLDFWYNPTYSNYFRLLDSLEELGHEVSKFRAEQAPDPRKSFFRYDMVDFTVDFLPEIKAPIKFRTAFSRKDSVGLGDTEISFISFEDLVMDKQTNPRAKDIDDVNQLGNSRQTGDK